MNMPVLYCERTNLNANGHDALERRVMWAVVHRRTMIP